MSDANFGKIGKFDILSPIGAGGMADVYRCRLRGPGGFEKIVVVKRIRGERAADPCFVNMFLDEARLAASLNHPNIVQVFEIGEADGLPYIAMEYVKGPTFSALLREARRAGALPPGHVARVMADVCEGLHHAHTALGPGGEPLGLVHRDVSPQNILVSREGRAKLLDFGVAKANGRLTDTLAGTLKGKLRYMAPEQLTGQVDHRADLFSVGVCLFEATTGQNPYGPPTLDEVALFHRIGTGKYRRPSELVPGYPAALEEIVLSAIQPDPDRRCATARDLQEQLERFAAREPFQASPRAVADWVRGLFPDPDESGPTARPLPARAGDNAGPRGRKRRSSPFNPLAAVLSPETSISFAAPGRLAPAPPLPVPPIPPSRRPWRTGMALAGALGSMVAGAAIWAVMQRPHVPPPRPMAAPLIGAVPPLASDLLAAEAAQAYVEAAETLATGGQAAAARELLGKARGLAVKDPELRRRVDAVERQLAVAAPVLAPGKPARRPRVTARPTDAPPDQGEQATPPLLAAPAPAAPQAAPRALPAATKPAAGAPVVQPRDIYSARPLAHVPPPDLPRIYRAQDAGDLERMLRRVEQEAVRAGCSAPFSRGITDALYRALTAQGTPEIYPAGLYYLIVNEAAVGREKQSASHQLAAAHRTGLVKALKHLPVARRGVN